MVRRIVPVRAVSPSVPVPPVAVVERHHVIVQKIRRAAPAGVGQCRFGGHRVAFEKPGVRPQCRICAGRHVSDNECQWFKPALVPELHLRQVAAFVYGQCLRPWNRLGVVGVGQCVYVNAFWSPCHGCVRNSVMSVENYRRLSPVALSGDKSGTDALGKAEAFKFIAVTHCERITSCRID